MGKMEDNHGKPTYKKTEQAGGEDVLIYFWDNRDGDAFSGWWFGPKVGGDQVWAYHANKTSLVPPTTGWRVPFNGDIDPNAAMEVRLAPRPQTVKADGVEPAKTIAQAIAMGCGALRKRSLCSQLEEL